MSVLQYPETLRTVLIDDEPLARERLRALLAQYPFIHILGEAADGEAAIGLINTLKPELAFLDIQMPGVSGIDVIDRLKHIPGIVFVTVYNEYAVKAFEKNSLDYILKPVEADRLAITVKRAMEKRNINVETVLKIKSLIEGFSLPRKISTLPVKSGIRINLINVSDICFFQAKDKYVYVHTAQYDRLTDYTLSHLEECLPDNFLRVHRSSIINTLKIKEIQKYFKGSFVFIMADDKSTKIRSAYSYYDAIKTKLFIS